MQQQLQPERTSSKDPRLAHHALPLDSPPGRATNHQCHPALTTCLAEARRLAFAQQWHPAVWLGTLLPQETRRSAALQTVP